MTGVNSDMECREELALVLDSEARDDRDATNAVKQNYLRLETEEHVLAAIESLERNCYEENFSSALSIAYQLRDRIDLNTDELGNEKSWITNDSLVYLIYERLLSTLMAKRDYSEILKCYQDFMNKSEQKGLGFGFRFYYYMAMLWNPKAKAILLPDFIDHFKLYIERITSIEPRVMQQYFRGDFRCCLIRTSNTLLQMKYFNALASVLEAFPSKYSADPTHIYVRDCANLRRCIVDDTLSRQERVMTLQSVCKSFDVGYFECPSLILAQLSFLQKKELKGKCHVEHMRDFLDTKWKSFKNQCFTCNDKVASFDSHFLCKGCRVACFCSKDHQHQSSNNHFVHCYDVGHELLCPLMNTHGILRSAADGDIETCEQNFRRACDIWVQKSIGLAKECAPIKIKKRRG